MPRSLRFTHGAPAAVQHRARELGGRIAIARKRRRLTQRELAGKAGLAASTVRAVENGELATCVGAYLGLIWALGLEKELDGLLSPQADVEGSRLELARLPRRVKRSQAEAEDFEKDAVRE